MSKKSEANERLQSLKLLKGVLPTPVRPTEGFSSVARSLRENDTRAAASIMKDEIASLPIESESKDPVPELMESVEMREQIAGFAEVGMGFFQSGAEFQALPQSARGDRGGNPAVNRVFVSNERILLETSRIIFQTVEELLPDTMNDIRGIYGLAWLDNKGLPPLTYRAAVMSGNALETSLKMMDNDAIQYSEPDFVEHIGPRHRPTDPDFNKQWQHANIQSEKAWNKTRGVGVRIAVIDNGFDTTHPDLRFGALSSWYRSTFDMVDADFIHGTTHMPSGNHGTACAGMIAGIAGNSIGGCGVAFASDLSMIACLPDQIGTQATLARAIAYAAQPALEGVNEAGADIISCSLGPNGANWSMSAVLNDAIDFAAEQGRSGLGCPIFWACTNGNFPINADQVCSHPNVMAIGRSTSSDSDDGSGFGPELEFLAPGVDVWIPASGGGYHFTTGTSFAAPCAAGVGALALSMNMTLSATQLQNKMRNACDKIGPLPYPGGRNDRFGFGRINADRAV